MRIALTGGIACGKSAVARFLREGGVETLDADDVVHELLPDPIERRRLAAEVFANPEKRRALEAKLHPIVKARLDAFLDQGLPATQSSSLDTPHPTSIRLVIVPLLFEVHWDGNFDIIASVVSSRENQIARMMTTRGYSREEALARLASQLPVEEKAARSHYVIQNDGSLDELKLKTDSFITWLRNGRRNECPSRGSDAPRE